MHVVRCGFRSVLVQCIFFTNDLHYVQIKMEIFDSTKSSMLKTTHFAAGFSDDLTTKVIHDSRTKLEHTSQ
jgi:hypothetical protein